MEEQSVPWWRDSRRRTRAVVGVFLALALAGILFPAFTNYLFAGDQRVLVVTMDQDADQADRDRLKEACGQLPGVSVVADRGNPDPRVQGRFAVRFDIADITQRQETALAACVNQQEGVRGFLTENDGN
ncbi:MAG: hypothetical protein JWM62_2513 [Frankiales bacterium]|jgi:hypothetical protein|nr:hypothetical protein [Frankiales bacterium]